MSTDTMTTQNVTLREFQPVDAAELRRMISRTIEVSLAEAYASSIMQQHFEDHHSISEILADAAGGVTVVLESGGAIVATGTLIDGKITRMFVDPAWQNSGLGKRIMRVLELRKAHIAQRGSEGRAPALRGAFKMVDS